MTATPANFRDAVASFLKRITRRGLICLAAGALTHVALAGAPFLEKQNLFEAGGHGFAFYRIPGVVVTPKGTALAYCEARKNGAGDWGEIQVHLRRSTDGGRTWEPPRQVAHLGERMARNPVALARKAGGENEQTVNNPLAIVDHERGVIHLLYCIEYQRCFQLRSDDDGKTFSEPQEITAAFDGFRAAYNWKVIATGPGHGIQLTGGRLLSPVWLSTGERGHHPSVTATIYSDDGGKSWRSGGIALSDSGEIVDANEAAVVELAGGRVMMNARSESKANRRLVTISPDGAGRWSEPRFDPALNEPICMGSLVRFPEQAGTGRSRILFSHPDNLARKDGKEAPGKGRDRKNLSVKLSYDEGVTWAANKVLEPGASAYSDLAVLPDGTILCFYECASAARPDSPYGALTLARFNLEWLTDGRDALKK